MYNLNCKVSEWNFKHIGANRNTVAILTDSTNTNFFHRYLLYKIIIYSRLVVVNFRTSTNIHTYFIIVILLFDRSSTMSFTWNFVYLFITLIIAVTAISVNYDNDNYIEDTPRQGKICKYNVIYIITSHPPRLRICTISFYKYLKLYTFLYSLFPNRSTK